MRNLFLKALILLYELTGCSRGILSTTYDMLKRRNSCVDVRLFGQEILESSHAICAPDMLIKGQDIRNICSCDPEAIIMAGDGVGGGRIFHHAKGKYGVHQRVYILHNFKDIYGRDLYYYMKAFFSMEIEKGSAKSTVDSIRLSMLKDFYIIKHKIEE